MNINILKSHFMFFQKGYTTYNEAYPYNNSIGSLQVSTNSVKSGIFFF